MAARSNADKDKDDNPQAGVGDALAQVDEVVNDEIDKGYRGVEIDPTPNEHYTVPGVLAGKPTPETDEGLAEEARARSLGRRRG